MEGFGEFNLVRESSEGNGNQRPREEALETGHSTNDMLEVESNEHLGSRRHRHTSHQIQELEKFFKKNPHPDESARLELGRKLNLEPNQVKFWFQNKRTHIKTQTDRHGHIMLKRENEKLLLENLALKETLENTICNKCGGTMVQVADRSTIIQDLMKENARLREELSLIRQQSGRPSSSLAASVPTSTSENIPEKEKKEGYMELASRAMDELMKLGHVNAPLWNRSMETGGEDLNFTEYVRSFPPLIGTKPLGFVSEASRATACVSLKSLDLVESFLNADRWREMFAGMIGSSATMEVISDGTRGSRNGVLQLMQAEIQLISPSVPARAVKFIRFSRQQAEGVWAVVDLSIDAEREGLKCRRLPSGCIVHDMPDGFSKVIWVEHTEYDERSVHHQYRRLLCSGLGFGAQKWICALLRHCGWLRALSSPSIDYQLDQSTRTCLKGLARRMTSIFCAGVCLTGGQRWTMVSNIASRIMARRSMNGPGEPSGTILSATMSVWIPTTHTRLFDLLLNQELRYMWDILCHRNASRNVAHFSMSHDDGNPNSISLLGSNTTEQNPIMVLQETASDMTGSLIVYAPVDLPTISVLMANGDTSSAAFLPSGLYIVPGSGEAGESGSMMTVGFQMLLQDVVTMDTISTVNDLVSRTIQGINFLH